MTYTFIAQACSDLPTAASCRVMKVSTSGFYSWQAEAVTEKDLDDAWLTDAIVDIWRMSGRSYGSPRVHPELRLGQELRCSRKRVERLMAQAGICGIHRRRRRGCTRRDLDAEPSVFATDVSAAMLALAGAAHPMIETVETPADELAVGDSSFDVASCQQGF